MNRTGPGSALALIGIGGLEGGERAIDSPMPAGLVELVVRPPSIVLRLLAWVVALALPCAGNIASEQQLPVRDEGTTIVIESARHAADAFVACRTLSAQCVAAPQPQRDLLDTLDFWSKSSVVPDAVRNRSGRTVTPAGVALHRSFWVGVVELRI